MLIVRRVRDRHDRRGGVRRHPLRRRQRRLDDRCTDNAHPTRAHGYVLMFGSTPAAGCPPDRDRGAVTVEAALALCALTVFLAMAVGAVAAAGAAVRCT